MRDLRIDTLRGVCLLIMMVNHFPLFALQKYTVQPLGFVSAAEGFVFISGLVAGLVYFRGWLSGKVPETASRIRRRAIQLYFFQLVLLGLAWILANSGNATYLPYRNTFLYFYHEPFLSLISGMLLLYQPALIDVLPMYCVFLLLTPVVLNLFQQGRAKIVFLVSFDCYLLSQVPGFQNLLHRNATSPLPMTLGDFNFFAWQLLFITGLYFGSRRASGAKVLPDSKPLVISCLLLGVLFFLLRHEFIPLPGAQWEGLLKFSNKKDLGPLRVLNFAAIAVLIAVAAKYLQQRLVWTPLAHLGQHSLSVFALGTAMALVMTPLFLTRSGFLHDHSAFLAFGVLLGSLWIPVYFLRWYSRRFGSGARKRVVLSPPGPSASLEA